MCPVLPDIEHGNIEYSAAGNNNSATHYLGTIATYRCSFGFGLNGTLRRVCVGNGDGTMGMFNGSDPTCEIKSVCAYIIS